MNEGRHFYTTCIGVFCVMMASINPYVGELVINFGFLAVSGFCFLSLIDLKKHCCIPCSIGLLTFLGLLQIGEKHLGFVLPWAILFGLLVWGIASVLMPNVDRQPEPTRQPRPSSAMAVRATRARVRRVASSQTSKKRGKNTHRS